MKPLGTLILIIGIGIAIYAFNLNTNFYNENLPVVGNVRISNADLVSKKQNFLILSGFLAVIGIILLAVDSRNKTILQAANPTNNNKEMSTQEKQDMYKGYKVLMYIVIAIVIAIIIMNIVK